MSFTKFLRTLILQNTPAQLLLYCLNPNLCSFRKHSSKQYSLSSAFYDQGNMCLSNEVVQAAGSLQVCAGQVAGVESAIHSMVGLFESDNSAAVL